MGIGVNIFSVRRFSFVFIFATVILLGFPASQVFADTYNPTSVVPILRNVFFSEFASFSVSGEGVTDIVGVRLSMETITNALNQHLVIEIVSPSSTAVRLHDQSGGAVGSIEDVLYLDDLNNCPLLDTCVLIDGPGSFADFFGEDPNGTWSLRGVAVVPGPGSPGTADYTVYVNGDAVSWGTAVGTQLLINDSFLPLNDIDGDGIPDAVDNCPTVSNPSQTDTNIDGTGDACTASSAVCGSGTIIQGLQCEADLNAICGEGTFISGLQCLGLGLMAVGGTLLEINTFALFVGAIGVNPVITGLVVITIAGVAGQVAWFVHRKKRN